MKYYLVFIALFASILSCTTNEQKNIPDVAYSEYVRAYTAGHISRTAPIRIVLNSQKIKVGAQEVDQDWLKISPSIPGELRWVENNILEFMPEEWFDSGQEFKAILDLKSICNTPNELEEFRFGWRTYDQSIAMKVTEVNSYDDDPEWQYITGIISSSDGITNAEAEELVEAKQQGKQLSVSWFHNKSSTHTFTVDSVLRTPEAGELHLLAKGNAIGTKDQSLTQRIPGLKDFELIQLSVVQHPDQHIALLFSDPIDPELDLFGLIQIDGKDNHRTVVNRNEVLLYPMARKTGTAQVTISADIKNSAGYELGEEIVQNARFEMLKPQIRINDAGKTILPSTNNDAIAFEAVSLDAVDVKIIRIFEDNIQQFLQTNHYTGSNQLKRVGRVIRKKTISLSGQANDLSEWNTYFLDLEELIEVEPGAIYRVDIGFRPHQSVYDCDGEVAMESDDVAIPQDWDSYGEDESQEWDYYQNYYYYDWDDEYYYWDYDYSERENPCHNSYYRSWRNVQRNIIATDIGIISKHGTNEEWNAWVTDLTTGQPVNGAQLQWFNLQGQLLGQATSNKDGFAQYEQSAESPFLLVATRNKEKSYLKLSPNQALSVSKFDVAGSSTTEGMKGYIYGERGVWRPGDTLFLSFMLDDPENRIPTDHPVNVEVHDARHKPVFKETRLLPNSDHLSCAIPTSASAPTGMWKARFRVGNAVFSKSIRVETIKPNRLKINLQFDKEEIQASDNAIVGDLQVNWLHGAPANSLRTEIAMKIQSVRTQFGDHKDFIFDDPARKISDPSNVVFDEEVDENGSATVDIDINSLSTAPGKLKAVFNTRAFEKGGDFSFDVHSVTISPYDTYIGVKQPEVDRYRQMMLTDTTYKVQVRSVDTKGKGKQRKRLRYTVHKLEWRWWWRYGREDLSAYAGRNALNLVTEGEIETNNNGNGTFDLAIKYPDWGRYLVRIEDLEGGHATGFIAYFDWPGWVKRERRSNPDGETMLVLSTDKDEYVIGEKASVSFPGAANGFALVTIEDGTSVIHSEWIETQAGSNTYEFELKEGYAPNIYCSLSLIQPHERTANDNPLRMYGTTRIEVNDPGTVLQPLISTRLEYEPEETYEIEVSEKDGKAMSYTLAVVDEGLLSLTRFKTPDPHAHFYAQEALGVKTHDLYDHVINAYAGQINPLLSIGGDEEAEVGAKKRANRFKPVVSFLGPFQLAPGEKTKHELLMPNYIGAVRVMVVAKQGDAYGRVDQEIPVRKPLMVLGTLPRVLGPSEEVALPVNVFAMDNAIKDVQVSVKTNDLLSVMGSQKQTVHFDRIGDQIANFRLKVSDLEGIGKVNIEVKSNGLTARYDIELDVRNPNPPITISKEYVLEANQSWNLETALPGMQGTNEVVLEVSGFKPVDFGSRLSYLLGYPHGCVEQTTSRAFPQLYLEDAVEMTPEQVTRARQHISIAINRLQSFQHENGGFRYWNSHRNSSDWASTYVGHFLLEAQKKGFAVPQRMIDQWIAYQKSIAATWRKTGSTNQYERHELAQTYRLYTLALAGKPELGAMNRMKEIGNLSVAAKWQLSAAYVLAGKPEVAEKITEGLTTRTETYSRYSPYYGSAYRDQALVAEALLIMGKRTKAAPIIDELADRLSGTYWLSTQETSFALIAVGRFMKEESNNAMKYRFQWNNDAAVDANPTKMAVMYDLSADKIAGNNLTFENKGDRTLYARLTMQGQPIEDDSPYEENGLILDVEYVNSNDELIDVSQLTQGTDIIARVTVDQSLGKRWIPDVALTHIFPSGWEILNDRMLTAGTDQYTNSYFEHQDIRDDRVLTYFGMNNRDVQVYHVRLNAAYIGRFYLPSVAAEVMYDGEVNARTRGQWVEVVEPGVL